MGKGEELKAQVYVALKERGFPVTMSYRVLLSGVRGYKRVSLDIVYLAGNVPMAAFYTGPIKERKILKYRMSKIRFFTIESMDKFEEMYGEFISWYLKH